MSGADRNGSGLAGRVLRFGVLGGGNTAFAVAGLWFLVRVVGLPYPLAHVLVHLSAVTLAYVPSARWVFKEPALSWRGLLTFHGAYLAQLAVSTVVLVALVDGLDVPLLSAQLVAMAAAIVTSFTLQLFVVFGRGARSGERRSAQPSRRSTSSARSAATSTGVGLTGRSASDVTPLKTSPKA
jgi:putative flippase GtrA